MLQSSATENIFSGAAERGAVDNGPMPSGQSAGLNGDRPPAGAIVRTLAGEAEAVLRPLRGLAR